MGEVIALRSCKGCIHVFVCRYRSSVGGKNCTHKRMSKDVRPVVRGRWERIDGLDELDPRMRCSVCGSVETPLARHRFCPVCAADMRGE